MRKIDGMLSEQKKKLLRRVNMSAQHQVKLHILLFWFYLALLKSLCFRDLLKMIHRSLSVKSDTSMLTDNKFLCRNLILCGLKLNVTFVSWHQFTFIIQEALHIFPKMTADPVESGVVKVHLGGEGYNRKTLNRIKRSIPKQQVWKSYDVTHLCSQNPVPGVTGRKAICCYPTVV